MNDTLRTIAQNDTPSAVEVPQTLAGLAIWAAGRFGVSIVFAAVIALAARQMYEDNKATNESRYIDQKTHQVELMAYLTNRNDNETKRAVADAALARSLESLSDAITKLDFEAKTAHTKPIPP